MRNANMNNQDDALYEKWDGWIDHLDQEITNLYEQRHIFEEVQSIIERNPKIQASPGDFNFWLAIWYTSSMSVAVRRLTDDHKDCISYQRLLEGIKANPRVISRTRFKRLFVDHSYSETMADRCFDEFVGAGLEYMNLSDIDAEIQSLKTVAARVTHYVDKRIAHYDKQTLASMPKFGDLNDAIEHLGPLHHKYYSIFRCLHHGDMLPKWLYDWKEVFRHPWIDASESEP